MEKLKLGVLGSGNGSNFRAIADSISTGGLPAEVRIVISDVETAEILALAKEHKIRAEFVPPGRFKTRLEPEAEHRVVAAAARSQGRTGLVGPRGLDADDQGAAARGFSSKNHQYSSLQLLPAYPGLAAWEQGLAAGAIESGCTVHYVDEGMDSGEIIAQSAVPIFPSDTPKELYARIQVAEHQLYPSVIRKFCRQS